MRNYLLAAAALAALASPASARDKSGYIGIDLGGLLVEDLKIDISSAAGVFDNYATGEHKIGYDAGVHAGYDFGAIRAEAEFAYKRAGHDQYILPGAAVTADGRTRSMSVMGNLLLDFGDDDSLQGFVGGGVGLAKTRVTLANAALSSRSLSDSGFAWQVLAGLRLPVSDNVDLGVKYRFYNHELRDSLSFAPVTTVAGNADTKFRSHSLMGSLTFNLGAPAVPPPPPPPPAAEPAPPPPPPPATQTCPDGSVILATDSCPVPPPPPPPPAPEPVRG